MIAPSRANGDWDRNLLVQERPQCRNRKWWLNFEKFTLVWCHQYSGTRFATLTTLHCIRIMLPTYDRNDQAASSRSALPLIFWSRNMLYTPCLKISVIFTNKICSRMFIPLLSSVVTHKKTYFQHRDQRIELFLKIALKTIFFCWQVVREYRRYRWWCKI